MNSFCMYQKHFGPDFILNQNVINPHVRRRFLSESYVFPFTLQDSCSNLYAVRIIIVQRGLTYNRFSSLSICLSKYKNNLLLESRCEVHVYHRGAVLMLHLKLLAPIYNLHRFQLLLNIMLLLLPYSQNSSWRKMLFCNYLVNFQLHLLHSIVASLYQTYHVRRSHLYFLK